MSREKILKIIKMLERNGWSTTVPDSDDNWQATAWPAMKRDGTAYADAKKQHERLLSLGVLGPWERDCEGGLCCPIFGLEPESCKNRDLERSDYDCPM
jgi:hypothetical protein